MDNLNITFCQKDQSDDSEGPLRSGDMSVDENHDTVPPPSFVTLRKTTSSTIDPDFRNELQSFQNKILSMMEGYFSRQDEKISKLVKDTEDVKTSIGVMSDIFDELKRKVEDVDHRLSELEKKTSTISSETDHKEIGELQARLDYMEQISRSCNAEISNVPERRGENLLNVVHNIASIIKQPVTSQDIVAVHRVQQMNPTSSRPKNIIIRFSSQISRDNFISAARLKKNITSEQLKIEGTSHKIYINEHLTLNNKKLFRRARDAVRQHGWRFIWVKHGNIFVRAKDTSPAFTIRSEKDILKIKPLDVAET
ncbi:uncharacterized protein LOC135072136 [Ostrinia nubilalis]|uniref:uncharacterized protein LOC135072136 n=1 Tax=Ostrinia nubilalis TaxID=29057 RepID=UPI0030825BF2